MLRAVRKAGGAALRYFTIIPLEYRIIRHPRLYTAYYCSTRRLSAHNQPRERESSELRRLILILERHSKFIALLVADALHAVKTICIRVVERRVELLEIPSQTRVN